MDLNELLEGIRAKGAALQTDENDVLYYNDVQNALTQTEQNALKTYRQDILQILNKDGHISETCPLSRGQEALCFIHRFAPESSACHVGFSVRIRAELDADVLRDAFQSLTNRHACLRTLFPMGEDGSPVQNVYGHRKVFFEQTDASEMNEDELEKEMAAARKRPFDTEHGPLFHAHLFTRSPEDHILLCAAHNIICDSASVRVILSELPELYADRKTGAEIPRSSASCSYADFVRSESETADSPQGRESLDYWKKELGTDLPVLSLPLDHPRPRIRSYNGATCAFNIGAELTGAIRSLAEKEKTPLSDVLLAVFQALLYRYTRQPVILTGVATDARMTGCENMVGCFANQTVLRSDFSDRPGFRDFLGQVRDALLRGRNHQNCPFPALVSALQQDMDPALPPIFQVLFAWQGAMISEESGWELSEITQHEGQSDLVLDISEEKDSLRCAFRYNSDMFMPDTAERMAGHFQTLLRGIADDPDQPIIRLPLLTHGEKRKLLVELNDTKTEFPAKCVHSLFEDQVRKTPDAVALIFSTGDPEQNTELNYSELNHRANRLARYLQTKGVGQETVVGLCMERSPEMIVGILGILKAGGAYMPLDPAYPVQRLSYMLKDSGTAFLLTHKQAADRLPEFKGQTVVSDGERDTIGKQSRRNLGCGAGPDSLAGVIYTSGSTGKPKGVMITHRNLCNTVVRANHQFEITSGTRVLQFASFSFVMAAGDIFSSLCSGASLYVGTREALMPGDPLTSFLNENRIDIICMPSSSLSLLSPEKLRVKNILVAAEPCSADVMRKWAENRRLFIGYGLTEATGGATSKRCGASDTVPLIGRPNPNISAYILDEELQPLPAGVPGELHIGGAGVTRGYLNRPELTKEKFVPNPFSDEPGARLCRTGDIARYLPDGDMEFLCRADFQINIRGFRIEPGEVETALERYSEVKQSVVAVREDRAGTKRLVAYVVPVSEKMLSAGDLRDFLRGILPDYMVPAVFVMMDKLPLTPNGKTDRLALPEPAPDQIVRPRAAYAKPQTEVEQTVANICQDILSIERAGIKNNFFEIGADSLLLIRICDQLQKTFQLRLPVVRLFEFPTISSLGVYISNQLNLQEDQIPAENSDADQQLQSVPVAQNTDRIIVLSAINEERLKVYAGNMADFLGKKRPAADPRPPVTLGSVAYTLQIGRKSMNERLALVVPDIRTAAEKLGRYSAGEKNIQGLYTGNVKNGNPGYGLLLQGREGAEFIRIIIEDRKPDKLAQLWVSGGETDWHLLYPEDTPRRVPLPTYPFAKKRHWIEPENREGGKSEKSVVEKLHPLIDRNTSTLHEQSFSTILTGREFYMADHLVAGKKTLPGVAYIEMARAAGEIAVTGVIRKIKNIVWIRPIQIEAKPQHICITLNPNTDHIDYQISILENDERILCSQGKMELANSPVRETENNLTNIEEIKKRCENKRDKEECYRLSEKGGIQYGPGFQCIQNLFFNDTEILSLIKLPRHLYLTKNQQNKIGNRVSETGSQDFILHPSIMDAALQTSATFRHNAKSKKLYLPFSAEEVEIFRTLPEQCYAYATLNKKGNSVAFDIRLLDLSGKLLVQIKDFSTREIEQAVDTAVETANQQTLFFKHTWKSRDTEKLRADIDTSKAMLIFDSDDTLYRTAVERMRDKNIVFVRLVTDKQKHLKGGTDENDVYEVAPEKPTDYQTLVQKLYHKNIIPDCIIYNGKSYAANGAGNSQIFPRGDDLPVHRLLYLCQALIMQSSKSPIRFIYICEAMHSMTDDELQIINHSLNAAVSGFARVVHNEHSNIIYQTLELEDLSDTGNVLDKVINEFQGDDAAVEIRYRNEERQVKVFEEFNMEAESAGGGNLPLKEDGVYLITGAMGELGRIFSEYLAKNYKANLVLTGRSDFSPGMLNRGWQVVNGQEINIFDSQAIYVKADISKREDVQNLIETAKSRFTKIDGIIHAAGVLRDAVTVQKNKDEMNAVLSPKILGSFHLDEITKNDPLDFFVFFSSISAVIGNPGQCDYAYANSFMDNFALMRETLRKNGKRSGRALSINWPLWKEGGMRIDEQTELLRIRTEGRYPLPGKTGISVYEKGLALDINQFVVLYGNAQKIRQKFLKKESKPVEAHQARVDEDGLLQKVQKKVSGIVSEILKVDLRDIDPDADMSEYGFDSISLTELINKINEVYDLELMPAIFFEHSSIDSFAGYLCEEHKALLADYYRDSLNKDATIIKNVPESSIEIPKLTSRLISPLPRLHSKGSEAGIRRTPIAIIGISGVMPQSENIGEFWNHLKNGDDLITEIPKDRWDWKAYFGDPAIEKNRTDVKWGGFMKQVDQFDASFFNISPREAELMDPQQRIFLETVWKCIEDAGYKTSDLSGTKTGLFVGVSNGDYSELLRKHSIEAYTSTGMSHSILTNRISYLLNLRGPSEPVNTACSSSLTAIDRAAGTLWNNECEMAIAGGINVIIRPTLHISFSKAGMLSKDGRCKTFDKQADGYVRGEGSGAVLLKPLEKALADGDHIYALIRATAVNHGGHVSSLTVPNPNAQAELLTDAYTKAGIDPETVGYIEAHGTGTALGDPVEINGIKKAFKALYEKSGKSMSGKYGYCGIGSVKTNMGHLEAASGIAGLLKVVLSMKYKTLPASIHCNEINPQIQISESPFYIVDKTKPWKPPEDEHGKPLPRIAGVSSFGFGGSNAHVVLEEFENRVSGHDRSPQTVLPDEPHLFVLSAKKEERLRVYAGNMADFLKQRRDEINLTDVVYTLQIGREPMPQRLAAVVSDIAELTEKLTGYCRGKRNTDGLYIGNVKRDRENIGLLIEGEEGKRFVRDTIRNRKIDKLARLWVSGSEPDWQLLYSEDSARRIPLPAYPFEKKRHWIPAPAVPAHNTTTDLSLQQEMSASCRDGKVPAQLYYHSVWEKYELPDDAPGSILQGTVLVFDRDSHLADAIGKRLAEGSQIILVRQGEGYRHPEDHTYEIDPTNPDDYRELVRSLSNKGQLPQKVVHFWSQDRFEPDADVLKDQLAAGLYSVFYFTQAVIRHKSDNRLKFSTEILYLHKGSPDDPQPQYAALSGFMRSLMLEDAGFLCRTLEADSMISESADMLSDAVIREFSADTHGQADIRYSDGECFVRKLQEFDPGKEAVRDIPLEKNGVYLITGGMGGLGLIFAEYLAREYQAKLILTGRSDLTPEKEARLRSLEISGAEAIYLKADIADQEDADRVIRQSRKKFNGISGIIHCAGISRRGFIREISREDIHQVLLPKVNGTVFLDESARDEQLDFFVLFSSISVETASLGLSGYAFANCFMDHFAEKREKLRADSRRKGKTLFINWPLWKDGGMQPSVQARKILFQTLGMTLLETGSGLDAFVRGLTFPKTGFLFVEGDPGKIRYALEMRQCHPRQETAGPGQLTDKDRDALLNNISSDLIKTVSEILRTDQNDIDLDEPLNEYGFDSISLTEFAGRINERYSLDIKGVPLTPAVFFEYPSVSSLALHLLEDYTQNMADCHTDVKKQIGTRETVSTLPACSADDVQNQKVIRPGSPGRNDRHPIAVIGMSGVMPQSDDIDTFWRHLENGDHLITEIPRDRWDWKAYHGDPHDETDKTDIRWGGFMRHADQFDAPFFKISRREAQLMDPQQRIFLETAWKCVEDAGYSPSDLSGTKTGLFVGMANSGYRELMMARGVPIEPHTSVGTAASVVANRISYLLNLHGPSEPVDTACSSSLVALHRAVTAILNRECDTAIAGGINLLLTPTAFISLRKAGMLSPDGRCRTFDKLADGFVRGEGAGALLLKPLDKAVTDRDHIYAVIRGTAVNHGGRANSLTAPNTSAQADLLITAYEKADIDPATVGYIEAHGTGTELGDPVEADALKKAFAELYRRRNRPAPKVPHCGIGSVKTNIGHLEAAAGIAGIIKTILSMKHGKLPRTLHFEEINPYIRLEGTPFYIVDKTKQWTQIEDEHSKLLPRRAGVSSFGFGGSNAHVVLEEFTARNPAFFTDGPMSLIQEEKPGFFSDELHIFVFSAKDNERLRTYAKNMAGFLKKTISCSSEGKSDREASGKFEEDLRRIACTILRVNEKDMDVDGDFDEYGFDPVSLSSFSEQIYKKYDIDTGINIFSDHSSVSSLAQYMIRTHKDVMLSYYPTLSDASIEKNHADTGINPADVAYTLQIGREPMRERLAVVVSGIKGLIEKLEQFCEGKKNISDVYTGNIRVNREIAGLLAGKSAGEQLLNEMMHGKEFGKIAGLWAMGMEIDWWLFYHRGDRNRIPLPTYPFARERYWIPEERTRPETGDIHFLRDVKASPGGVDRISPDICVPVSSDSFTDYLTNLIAAALRLDPRKIDPGEDFEIYGLDSITISSLNSSLEQQFGKLPATLFFTYKSVRTLAEYFAKNHTRSAEIERSGFSPPDRPEKTSRDIAIIGLSGKFPMAEDIEAFWENLKAGRDCITEIPKERWDYQQYPDMYCKWGGFLEDFDKFDAQFFNISPNTARSMDPQARLFLQTVWSCIEDAGYTLKRLEDPEAGDQRANIGVFAGVSFNEYHLHSFIQWKKGNLIPANSQINSVANRVSYFFNFSGPSLSVDTACSSSLYAVHLACESIISGECEMAVAGGTNLSVHPNKYIALCNIKMLASHRNSKAFSEEGDGMISGEGVGAILLKPLQKAVKDRDHIYGVIKGTAVNHDGKTYGYTVPNPVAQSEVIKAAIERSDIPPRMISYVEAHGTGTSLGDPIEITGLSDAYAAYTKDTQFCAIGSVKSNIGHSEAAAGIAQLSKVLLQMKYKMLAPSLLSSSRLNPNIDFENSPFHVQQKLEKWKKPTINRENEIKVCPRCAGVSSFGAGGVNAHAIIEEYLPKSDDIVKTHPLSIIEAVADKTSKVIKEDEIVQKEYDIPEFRKWYRILLLKAFQKMGVLNHAYETYHKVELKNRINLAAPFHCLFEALLKILSESGFITAKEDTVTCTSEIENDEVRDWLETIEEKKESLMKNQPEIKNLVKLLWICLNKYPVILNGTTEPTTVMFPESSMKLVEGLYENNAFNPITAKAVRACVMERCKNLKDGEKVRILEVGAGTGGTSSYVLKEIGAYAEYLHYEYTDLSAGFLLHGEKKFGQRYNFMKFGRLDIEKDIVGQEYAQNGFDVVIAVNVLHATRKITDTLHNVNLLLKDNGLLLLNELIKVKETSTLTFGLLKGWWMFEDRENRLSDSPLLGIEKWKELLTREGFKKVYVLGDEKLSHRLIMAERNELMAKDADSEGVIIPLSAQTEKNLLRYADQLKVFLKRKQSQNIEPSLEDIAYTLQVGREAMPFRLALIAKSVDELIKKLDILCDKPECIRGSERESVFTGSSNRQRGDRVGKGSGGDSCIRHCVEKRDIREIAELWTRGEDFDWNALYPQGKPRRISLPTYPFLKQRYWIAESPGLPDLSPAPSEISLDSEDNPGYDRNDLPEISPFLAELADAPEKEQEEMISGFLQKKVGDLLGFASDDLPALDQGFFALGMESMQALELQAEIEETFRVKISDTAAFDYPDIQTFSVYLRELIPFDELEADLPDDKESALKQVQDDSSELLSEISDSDLEYLTEAPLPEDIVNMDIKKVETMLEREIEYFSTRKPEKQRISY